MSRVRIAGAGLAGSAAAIAAMRAGSPVRMWDPARIPKHKVCGEFLTPEIGPVLERLGLWDQFLAANPARMTRMRLIFGDNATEGRFPEPAFGLSRYRLDALLRQEAEQRGAQWIVERVPGQVDIVAHGRQNASTGRDRLFGFKSHFRGPVSDAVELYFFDDFYVGVNPVEDGVTNVCGLGSEAGLRRLQFDYDALMASHKALSERLKPLSRAMEWLSTGPLLYQSRLPDPPAVELLAGDALQFVDPFTGTGMTIAIWTGALAGRWAAEKRPLSEYYATVRAGIARQYHWCGWLRTAMEKRWPLRLAPLLPPAWLYALTRPKLESR
ncbi:MAG: NAD(P)/FAD-dependent oxidoreductase [Bryobacteraceae bacterium]